MAALLQEARDMQQRGYDCIAEENAALQLQLQRLKQVGAV
jgi:hypothetical protein